MASNTLGSHYSITLLLIIFLALAYQANSRTYNEATMYTKHEQWMARHGRVYDSSLEKERRFKIFKANVEFIENFNQAGNHTYTLGTNKFTDLTSEEFMATHTGNKMPRTSTMYNTTLFKYQDVSDVPPSIDWRDQGAVTDVKNQYQCGSCWAFTAVAATEGLNKIKTGELISLSEQQIVDCDGQPSCNGNSIENAFEFIKNNQGLDTESDYPYTAQEGTCRNTYQRYGAISGYESVPSNDEEALQRAVANQPVSVGVDQTQLQHYDRGVISGECGNYLTHAITIVGYGTSEYGMKYWICKNSWGANWGDDGYVMIQRESGAQGGMCGIAMDALYPTA